MSTESTKTRDDSQSADLITRDMTIGEIVEQYPSVAEIFLEYGLHCVGCHVAHWETIEEGARGHGMDEDTIDMMVKDANTIAKRNAEQTQSQDTPLKITDAAVARAKAMLEKVSDKSVFRIAVLEGGCSGYSYSFTLEEKGDPEDTIFEQGGVTIVVDKDSLIKLNGCTVDYIDTFAQSGFKVHNPNASTTCGCGSSFA